MAFGITCVIIFGLLAAFQTWRAREHQTTSELYKKAYEIYKKTFDTQRQLYKNALAEQQQAFDEERQIYMKILDEMLLLRSALVTVPEGASPRSAGPTDEQTSGS